LERVGDEARTSVTSEACRPDMFYLSLADFSTVFSDYFSINR
jgi:hypothetical protein